MLAGASRFLMPCGLTPRRAQSLRSNDVTYRARVIGHASGGRICPSLSPASRYPAARDRFRAFWTRAACIFAPSPSFLAMAERLSL